MFARAGAISARHCSCRVIRKMGDGCWATHLAIFAIARSVWPLSSGNAPRHCPLPMREAWIGHAGGAAVAVVKKPAGGKSGGSFSSPIPSRRGT
jgi:hypothetical protein